MRRNIPHNMPMIKKNEIKENEINKKNEDLLTELKKSFELFVTEESKGTRENTEKYLVFMLGKEPFALPISQLEQVLYDKPVIPVPKAPFSISGIINYKNKILTVTNMHNLLQIPIAKTSRAYILVAKDIKKDIKFETAILVDELVNLVAINQEAVKPEISGQKESVARLIKGEFYFKDRLITLLDLTGIE